jgi:hypothetical protein
MRSPSGSKGTRFCMGYEAKKRHPDAQGAEVQIQVERARGEIGIRSRFL